MTDQEYKRMIQRIVVPANLSSEDQSKRYQPLIDFLKTETPEKLYRFRSCKARTIDELDHNKLSFSPAHVMNDDFDGLLYFDKAYIKAELINAMTPQKIGGLFERLRLEIVPAEIQKHIPAEILQHRLESLTKLTPDEVNSLLNRFWDYATNEYDKRMSFLSQVTQNQKIVSLSTEVSSPAMWGYYADDGKGFALSYDLREPAFVDYCIVPVIYSDERLNATQYATWLFQQQIMKSILIDSNTVGLYPLFQQMIPCPDNFMSTKVLIHKATNWRHEKEWRLIYYEKNSLANEKFPHIIKKPSGIYLGRNISSIHEKILCHIAVERGIPVYKMTVLEDDSAYKLYPKPHNL